MVVPARGCGAAFSERALREGFTNVGMFVIYSS